MTDEEMYAEIERWGDDDLNAGETAFPTTDEWFAR